MTEARHGDVHPRGGRFRRLAAGILREPLVGFALAGVAIFLLTASGEEVDERPSIEISAATFDDLVAYRTEILGRKLAPEEKAALIEKFVEQEILVREAVARGLHLHDSRVRVRLVDKMAFLLEEEPPEPTAADLRAQLASDPERYKSPTLVSFDHVFFDKDKAAAAAALPQLRAGRVEPADLGVLFWLGQRMERYALPQLLTVLGYEFTGKLRDLPRGEWTGPVRSGRGWHLVRLEAVHAPEMLPEPDLTRRLTQDWKAARRAESRRRRMEELRAFYDVRLPGARKPAAGAVAVEPVR